MLGSDHCPGWLLRRYRINQMLERCLPTARAGIARNLAEAGAGNSLRDRRTRIAAKSSPAARLPTQAMPHPQLSHLRPAATIERVSERTRTAAIPRRWQMRRPWHWLRSLTRKQCLRCANSRHAPVMADGTTVSPPRSLRFYAPITPDMAERQICVVRNLDHGWPSVAPDSRRYVVADRIADFATVHSFSTVANCSERLL